MNTLNVKIGEEAILPEGSEMLVNITNLSSFASQFAFGRVPINILVVSAAAGGMRFSSGDAIGSSQHAYATNDKLILSIVNGEGAGACLHVKSAQGDKFVVTV